MKRKLTLLLLFFWTLALHAGGTYRITQDGVSSYRSPEPDAPAAEELHTGHTFTGVRFLDDQWASIPFQSERRYVLRQYLAREDDRDDERVAAFRAGRKIAVTEPEYTPVLLRRDEKSEAAGLLSADSRILVTEIDADGYWARYEYAPGKYGWVDLMYLSFPEQANYYHAASSYQVPALKRADTTDDIEKIRDIKVWGLPRDGAYLVKEDGLLALTKTEDGKWESVPTHYKKGQIIGGVKFIDRKTLSVPLADGRVGQVKSSWLLKVGLREIVEQHGLDSQIAQTEIELLSQVPGFTVFNGWKAGKRAVWLIIVASAVLLVFTLRQWGGRFRGGAALKTYGLMLVVLSSLELWYFMTMGVYDMSWFLRESGGFFLLNFLLMTAVASHQAFSLYTYTRGIQADYGFRFNLRLTYVGLGISLALYFLWKAAGGSVQPETEGLAGIGRELAIVLCVVAGQLPQIVYMLVSYYRQVPPWRRKPVFMTMLVYLIALIGTVSLATMTVGVIVVIVLQLVLVYALFAKGLKAGLAKGAGAPAPSGNVYDEIEVLKDRIASGSVNPERGAQWLEELQRKRDGNA